MAISTLTSKGQITLPKHVRERLRLRAGDRLDFRIEEDGSIRVYPIARQVAEVFGALAGKARRADSADETRGRLGRAFRKVKS